MGNLHENNNYFVLFFSERQQAILAQMGFTGSTYKGKPFTEHVTGKDAKSCKSNFDDAVVVVEGNFSKFEEYEKDIKYGKSPTLPHRRFVL